MAGEEGAERWYVRARGRVLGPLSWAQLLALRERGQLARFDQVSRDRQTWAPADSVERLFSRTASGGAFTSTARATERSARRGPQSDSVDYLILDDDQEERAGPGAGTAPSGALGDGPTSWYYAESGAPQGPVGLSELERLACDGRIGPGTLYWRSGLDQWTPGSDLPELNRLWLYDDGEGAPADRAKLPPRGWHAEPAPEAAPRVSPNAILSLALNLFCLPGNLAAIAVGVMALRQIARSGGTQAGRGLAIAGVVIGGVGLLSSAALVYWWYFAG
jgi:hypothetical protein